MTVVPPPEVSQVPRGTVVLTLDVRAERSVAWLRTLGAVAALAAAVWMASLGPGAVGAVLVCIAALAGMGWLLAAAAGRRRARNPGAWSLTLDDEALRLREGAVTTEVPWTEVDLVEVDEDRLVVRVCRTTGETVWLEPRYPGLSVHGLADLVDTRARAARTRVLSTSGESGTGRSTFQSRTGA
jgi:hypothetical protein